MDIRLVAEKFTVGIECKNKLSITYNDLQKFDKDKVINTFAGAILVSTGPVPKLLDEPNTTILENRNMYIYSDDTKYITTCIWLYVNMIYYTSKECDILKFELSESIT